MEFNLYDLEKSEEPITLKVVPIKVSEKFKLYQSLVFMALERSKCERYAQILQNCEHFCELNHISMEAKKDFDSNFSCYWDVRQTIPKVNKKSLIKFFRFF